MGALILGELGNIVYLLFANGEGVVDGEAVQVDVLVGVLGLVDLVEDLPSDVPANLLLRVFILLWTHSWIRAAALTLWLALSSIFLGKIFVHLGSNAVKFKANILISLKCYALVLLLAELCI